MAIQGEGRSIIFIQNKLCFLSKSSKILKGIIYLIELNGMDDKDKVIVKKSKNVWMGFWHRQTFIIC